MSDKETLNEIIKAVDDYKYQCSLVKDLIENEKEMINDGKDAERIIKNRISDLDAHASMAIWRIKLCIYGPQCINVPDTINKFVKDNQV